jgi:hypothetical protein
VAKAAASKPTANCEENFMGSFVSAANADDPRVTLEQEGELRHRILPKTFFLCSTIAGFSKVK